MTSYKVLSVSLHRMQNTSQFKLWSWPMRFAFVPHMTSVRDNLVNAIFIHISDHITTTKSAGISAMVSSFQFGIVRQIGAEVSACLNFCKHFLEFPSVQNLRSFKAKSKTVHTSEHIREWIYDKISTVNPKYDFNNFAEFGTFAFFSLPPIFLDQVYCNFY